MKTDYTAERVIASAMEGGDLYENLARKIFQLDADEPVTASQRRHAKITAYSTAYAGIMNLATDQEFKVRLTNDGTATNAQMGKWLHGIVDFLEERAEYVFPCTCFDYDEPRGSLEHNTNAFNHHPNCPIEQRSHTKVILESTAAFFMAHNCDIVAAGNAARRAAAKDSTESTCIAEHRSTWTSKVSRKKVWQTRTTVCGTCGRKWRVRTPIK